ncbi:C45 family peptidase [Flammeovirga pacifica]|uniref:Peptidase C45 n=1 Tax=Flammeovirga pacifica TaxID=915059 RepID=A0A1S1Z4S4_FLAPC|nr:hypothetical protein [Flammeovirga pacifica]OHX68227.1 hypothetical protein NH26_18685 [Flammeovirga pacifica]
MKKFKTLFAVLLVSISSLSIAQEKQKIGDNLSYFYAERTAGQETVDVIDVYSVEEEAQYLAKQPRTKASEDLIAQIQSTKENARKVNPEYAALMERQAEIRGVDVTHLYAATSIDDVLILQSLRKSGKVLDETIRGCTTIAFDNGIVGQNNDMGLAYLEKRTEVVRTDNRIYYSTNGGHFQGMGKNVAITINFLATVDLHDNLGQDNLLSTDVILATATQANSVADFVEKMEGYEPIVPLSFTVADRFGHHAVVRMTKDGIKIVNKEDRGSASANHNDEIKEMMFKKYSKPEANAICMDSFARETAALNYLTYTTTLDVDAMKYMLEHRPLNMSKDDDHKTFVTVESMVFDIKTGTAWVTGDNPRFAGWTKVKLAR